MASMVSVIVPTMNRGASIRPTIEAVLASSESRFELLVADQSVHETTQEALAPFLSDTRLKYIKVDCGGKTYAINQAAEACSSPVILVLDDDCLPQPNWVSTMLELFSQYPLAGVAFCSVNAASFDASRGFIPNAQYARTREITSLGSMCWGWIHLESGMAIRRTAFDAVQGFDELLGPGAPFVACEGPDLAVRALNRGFTVVETNQTAVVHHGFYTFEQGRRITRRYWYGIGTASTKLARGVNRRWIIYPIVLVIRHFVVRPLCAVIRLQPPRGSGGLLPFLRGVRDGVKTPLKHGSLLYKRRQLAETTPPVHPKAV